MAILPLPRPRGGLYLRKSLGKSAEKTEVSLEIQEAKGRAKMEEDGVDCVAVFRDVSPRWELHERPDLSACRELVKGRGVEFVYAYDTSRLATGALHQALLLEEAQRHGVAYRFVTEQVDADTPLGQLVWLATSTFNAMELARIRDRTAGGKAKRIAQGKLLSYHVPPFGYRFAAGGRDALVAYAPHARHVRRIFEAVAGGQTTGDLAVALTAEGVPTPTGGTRWQTSTLGQILHNPTYKGETVVGRRRTYRQDGRTVRARRDPSEWTRMPPGVAPPLVSAALWHRAEEALRRNRKGARRSMGADRATEFLLRGGLAVCARCGRGLHAITVVRERARGTVTYRSYGCGSLNAERTDARPPCPEPPRIRAEALDRAVWRRVLAELDRQSRSEDAAGQRGRRREAEGALRRAERAIRDQERALERTAAELVQTDDPDEQASLRALRRLTAAQLQRARLDRDAAAQALLRTQQQDDALLSLLRVLTEEAVRLNDLVPGEGGPARYQTMRGLLDGLGVRVLVWHKDAVARGEGPPAQYLVLPWDDPAQWPTAASPSCSPGSSQAHDPERLATLLRRLTAPGAGAPGAGPGGGGSAG